MMKWKELTKDCKAQYALDNHKEETKANKIIYEPVKCYLRLKPYDKAFNVSEYSIDYSSKAISIKGEKFFFSDIFDESCSQQKVWESGVKETIDEFIGEMKSGLIFAYGISNSGKTYSIVGTDEEKGVLPISLVYLFNYIDNLRDAERRKTQLSCSFIEIYNEDIFDLLSEERNKLAIRERNKRFFLSSKPLNIRPEGDHTRVAV